MNPDEKFLSLNHHLRLALDQVSDGILTLEAKASTPLGPRIVYANQAVSEFTGFDISHVLGQPLGMLFDRDHLPDLLNRLPLIDHGSDQFRVQRDIHLKGGGRKRFEWSFLPVKNSLGEVINYTIRISSIDQQPKGGESREDAFKEDLAKSRLESLLIVSSGIAHDFRNGLLATRLAIDLVKMIAEDNAEILSYLELAELSLESNCDLASQMVEFTRGEEAKVRIVGLHGLLKKSARMSTIGNNVTPELEIQKELWDVEIDSIQIAQVFQNIIINGCQAMPNGGPMKISAKNSSIKAGNPFGLPEGNYVVIGICDRGCGIPKDKIDKIFDPYFTTKPNGTGIGLASCKQIVERHHGKIMVESTENSGAEFVIFLPAASSRKNVFDDDRTVLPAQKAHAAATRQFLNYNEKQPVKDRILVVDDDPQIRKLASEILKRLGFDAVVAADGEKAMLLVRHSFREARSFSVVILDLNLPRISGWDVMKEIRRVDPKVKIVMSSGDANASAMVQRDSGWDGVLQKPYGKGELEDVLIELKTFDPDPQSHHQLQGSI